MDTKSIFKWLTLAFLAAFSFYVVMPPKDKIRLGLDLQGGTSFTVQIDKERLAADLKDANPKWTEARVQEEVVKIMRDADDRTLEVLRKRIDALGTEEPIIAKGDNHRIHIQIPGADAVKSKMAEASVKSAAFLTFQMVHVKNDTLVQNLLNTERTPAGFKRSSLPTGGTCFIRDAETFAKLSQKPTYSAELGRFATPSIGYKFVLQDAGKDINGVPAYVPCFVSRAQSSTLTGDSIVSAKPYHDTMKGGIGVTLAFDADGRKKFAKITGDYNKQDGRKNPRGQSRQLAIILDDVVRSAPVLNTAIPSGSAEISGGFKWSEAVELANVLRSGSLKAPIRIIEKRSVSPSLGQDAIDRGLTSAVIGVALVFAFMLVYYMYCGVVADIALLLNMILWPAGMIIASGLMSVFVKDGTGSANMMQLPVLTLPGIAGLVLSIGMAVDANVLIFERVREEFRAGKAARTAIASGYDRAFLAIFDSNLTTLLTGVILFIFGSGPIRGFAVTLCGGIIISMFTALVVTRLIFNVFTPETRIKPYKMLQMVPENFNFDFFKYAKPAIMSSLTIIVVTLGIFFYRAFSQPASVMAVDFTGGTAMTFDAEKDLDAAKVREIVKTTGVTDQVVQTSIGANDEAQILVKTSTVEIDGKPTSQIILDALNKANPDNKVSLLDEERVGSQIGDELKADATWSVIVALVGIILYVAFRFEFGFGVGAVVALAHDALITLGIYTICGNQVSLTTVAALLTIVGYSVNDTIVIFDRVREDLRKDDTTDFKTLCRTALNATLSRTILTTVSTLVTVFALYFFGGPAIHDFAFALLVGMIAGTYSTLFIATPVMIAWYKGTRPKAVVEDAE